MAYCQHYTGKCVALLLPGSGWAVTLATVDGCRSMRCCRSQLFRLGIVCRVTSALHACEQRAAIGFNRDVRPILSENCFVCHGPGKEDRKADLRLDLREVALQHKAIIPSNAAQSKLVQHV